MLGSFLVSVHTWWIALSIVSRHDDHVGPVKGVPSRLEDAIVETLLKPEPRIYVHWGVYASGKSWAARNAAARLQAGGRLAMLVAGYDFTHKQELREWLRVSVGVPEDRAGERLGSFLPSDHTAVMILHNAEFLIRQYGERALVDALGELGIPVLIMVSSWERAVDLKGAGCRLLGEPGFGRWTPMELDVLWERSRSHTGGGKEQKLELVRECGELSGAPGILLHELRAAEFDRYGEPNLHRARLIHAEWQNGSRALKGEDMGGVTGRFPDKDGRFHWDEPRIGGACT
jgi:hypothetical protein